MNYKSSLPTLRSRVSIFSYACASLFLFSACFSANAFTEQGSGDAMLSGDFDVSGGQATYSLPISVSVGRAGLQPNLSFKYQSDSPNGAMGMGWNIAGLSSVYRCGKNLAIDDVWGGVNFNNDDRFCLDGERLIAVSGAPGGDETEYRLEKNGYSKIISYGSQGSGPSYFRVWQKDGSVYEYGNTADAKVELPKQSHVYKWTINKITDITKRNNIVFNYTENTDGHYIKRISYVGGEVEFNYEDRDDKISRYLGGSLLKRTLRLNEVKIKDSISAEVGRYALTYGQSTGTQRSILKKIQYCSEGTCTSPITFNWQSTAKVKLNAVKSTGLKSNRLLQYFDSNRDGNSSPYVVGIQGRPRNSALQGSINQPSLSTCRSNKGQANSYMPNADGILKKYCSNNLQAVDMTGSGLQTLETGLHDKKYVDLNNDGKATETVNTDRIIVDINNDGYLDAVSISNSSECHSRGSGGDSSIRCSRDDYSVKLQYYDGKQFTKAIDIFHSSRKKPSISFVDINHDGYPEFVRNGDVYLNYFG